MTELDEVVCPRCKIGFAPETTICPVCKIPLVSEDWLSETPAPVILTDDLSSLEELRAAGLDWIHHLQDKLAEAGIPHRIELSDPRNNFFSVFIRPEDLPRAKDDVWRCSNCNGVVEVNVAACPHCGCAIGWDKMG